METVYDIVLIVHFLGLASLIGGWLVQMRASGERQVNPAMLHGALTQVVTGLAIVGLGESVLERDYDYVKVTVKLVIAALVLLLTYVNRRREVIPDGLYFIIGGMAIANVAIAVLW